MTAATAATAARLVLGAVFLWSGTAKLRDGAWPDAAARFGLPRPLAAPLAYSEIVLGAVLAAGVAPPWPAVAALVLLGLFTGAVVAHVTRGDDAPCHCFGSARPVTWRTVGRNCVLIAVAAAATR